MSYLIVGWPVIKLKIIGKKVKIKIVIKWWVTGLVSWSTKKKKELGDDKLCVCGVWATSK